SGSAARPVDLPEARHRGRQLEVAAEALEARLVREALAHSMEELVERRGTRIAELEAATLPAFLAAHVYAHREVPSGRRRSAGLAARGALFQTVRGGEKGFLRPRGEDADRHRLRHPLTLLHQEGGADEAALAVGGCLQLVVAVVVVEVAAERLEVDLVLLGVK